MLRTRICALLGIEHPIVLGGMGSATSPELVAAVSAAGGSVCWVRRGRAREVARDEAAIRAATARRSAQPAPVHEGPGKTGSGRAARVVSTEWRLQRSGRLCGRAPRSEPSRATISTGRREGAARAGVDVIVRRDRGRRHVGVWHRCAVPCGERGWRRRRAGAGGVARERLARRWPWAPTACCRNALPRHRRGADRKGFQQAIVGEGRSRHVVTEIPDVANGQVWPGPRGVRGRLRGVIGGRTSCACEAM